MPRAWSVQSSHTASYRALKGVLCLLPDLAELAAYTHTKACGGTGWMLTHRGSRGRRVRRRGPGRASSRGGHLLHHRPPAVARTANGGRAAGGLRARGRVRGRRGRRVRRRRGSRLVVPRGGRRRRGRRRVRLHHQSCSPVSCMWMHVWYGSRWQSADPEMALLPTFGVGGPRKLSSHGSHANKAATGAATLQLGEASALG
jgi:hypothetical protein